MPWVVVAVKFGEMARATRNVHLQGFTYLNPEFYDRRRKRRRPVFGRYFFVELSRSHDNWNALHSTRGIQYVLTFKSGKWAYVPRTLIWDIKRRMNEHGILDLDPKKPGLLDRHGRLKKGTKVGFKSGHKFASYIGTVEGMTVKQQEKIVLDVFGSVLVDIDDLEALEDDIAA